MAVQGMASIARARERLQSDFGKQRQETEDALKRRFAARGGLSSGAYLKAQEKARTAEQGAYASAAADLGAAEADIQEQRAELDRARAFQTSERMGSEKFAASEAQKQAMARRKEFEDSMSFERDKFDKEFTENQKVNRANFIMNAANVDNFMQDYDEAGGRDKTGLSKGDWIADKYNKIMSGQSLTDQTRRNKFLGIF